ncbi:cadherin-like protein 26 [Aplochiton taeniatus]
METVFLSLLVVLWLGIPSVLSSDILHRQKRHWIIDSFQIEEEHPGPFPYVLGTMTFEARDKSNNIVETKLGVEVRVQDINDNTPIFQSSSYEVNIQESVSQDSSNTANGTFDFQIVSVTPEPKDLEFFIEKEYLNLGTIKFKGCLSHEKADKYTILVEAKDRGEKVQLSSTCTVTVNIEDGNNHMPVFTGQTGPGTVKEGEENVCVLRLQVSDEDSVGSATWRAIYTIQGDTSNNFRMTTDPKTNEGLLYVKKQLDFEEAPLRNLSISVGNEAPFYSCRVKGRRATGSWDVEITGAAGGTQLSPPPPSTRQVTVRVVDVNDPPVFTPAVKHVTAEDNLAAGQHLETLTSTDREANNIVYLKGEDPADWVTVDSKTGKITTVKILYRESQYIVEDVYKVTFYAVDDGKPPATGTGTLIIHLIDVNNNLPFLVHTQLDMCLSEEPSVANITAIDLDGDPYGGPFNFELRGDVQGKWRMDPQHGYSVNLVKESNVYAGHHDLQLEVFDRQGQSAVHNLTVTVCNCATEQAMPNCRHRRATGSRMGVGAIGILSICMLLMLGALLMASLLSCKREQVFVDSGDSGENLIVSHTESIGTDCKSSMMRQGWGTDRYLYESEGAFRSEEDASSFRFVILSNVLHQAKGVELGDYAPHPYAKEGDEDTSSQLDAISIPEDPFDTGMLHDLGFKFDTLASICRP